MKMLLLRDVPYVNDRKDTTYIGFVVVQVDENEVQKK